MNQRDLILELLDDISPEAYCDDCISAELDIQPRQQVNQVCRSLEATRQIQRTRSPCRKCGKTKITNTRRPVANDASLVKTRPPRSTESSPGNDARGLDI